MNLGSDPDLKVVSTIVDRTEQRFNTTRLATLTNPYAGLQNAVYFCCYQYELSSFRNLSSPHLGTVQNTLLKKE